MGRTWELTSAEELIMLTIYDRPMYGLEITEKLSEASEGKCQINCGTLYPALKRLQKRGLIECKRVQQEEMAGTQRNGHARKYYRITSAGERLLCHIDAMRAKLRDGPECEPT